MVHILGTSSNSAASLLGCFTSQSISVGNTLTKQKLDSSLKRLSIDTLSVQVGCTEFPLASLLLVLIFCGETLSRHGLTIVSSKVALQALMDSAHTKLLSDTQTFISPR